MILCGVGLSIAATLKQQDQQNKMLDAMSWPDRRQVLAHGMNPVCMYVIPRHHRLQMARRSQRDSPMRKSLSRSLPSNKSRQPRWLAALLATAASGRHGARAGDHRQRTGGWLPFAECAVRRGTLHLSDRRAAGRRREPIHRLTGSGVAGTPLTDTTVVRTGTTSVLTGGPAAVATLGGCAGRGWRVRCR